MCIYLCVCRYIYAYIHTYTYIYILFEPTPGGHVVKVDFRFASLQDHHSSDTLGIFWIIHITH